MPKFTYPDWLLSVVFGFGLVLFGCHAEHFILHNAKGETLIFLPQWGFLLMFGVMAILYLNKRLTLGKRIIWMPLAGISFFIAINPLFTDCTIYQATFGVMLFAMYLVGRTLGKQIFLALIPFVAIEAISCIVMGSIQGDANGGFLILAGILACFSIPVLYRWVLLSVVLAGAIYSGSPAVMIALSLLVMVAIHKDDFSRYSAVVAFIIVLSLGCSYYLGIHSRTEQVAIDGIKTDIVTSENDTGWGNGRLPAYKDAASNISFFGHGYAMYETERTETSEGEIWSTPTVHNVPLIIVDQIGVIPALLWLFVTLYCLIKTTWKYAIVCILGLCMFDHFVWTVFAPYWWVIIGVATTCPIEDNLFKGVLQNDKRKRELENWMDRSVTA